MIQYNKYIISDNQTKTFLSLNSFPCIFNVSTGKYIIASISCFN